MTTTGTTPTPADESVAVALEDITKRFPGVVANDAVTLRVERGSVHALLGENGAGKTTLMSVLYGLYQPEGGRIVIDGVERTFGGPRDAIEAGIGMIHQHFMLVEPMTVAENIALGNEPRKWFGMAVDREAINKEIRALCEQYGFDIDPTATVADLGVGARQRVEILKTLYRGADILILDEPTAVLTPQEVESLYRVLESLTDQGKTIIFITHKLDEATHAADAITVLRDGRQVGTVDPDASGREQLAELMIGREVVFDVDADPATPGEDALSVLDLTVTDDRGVETVSGLDFTIKAGEIFGIAGVDGNGQAELVDVLTGLRTPDTGTVWLEETDVTDWTRRERIDAGMGYVPEDRQEEGLVMPFDLTENAALGNHHDESFVGNGVLSWDAIRTHTDKIINTYDVEPADADAEAASLSGGNQQKFVVGRELLRDPTVLIAANPTRGVDVGSTEFIREQLVALRDSGVAVLLISSKLDEVRSLSDRLAVLYEGEFMDVRPPAELSEEQLGLLMAGEIPDTTPASASGRGGMRADTDGGRVRTQTQTQPQTSTSTNADTDADADDDLASEDTP